MAAYTFQVRLQGESNLPEDVFENVLCYEVNAPDTVDGTCQEIANAYDDALFIAGINGIEVRAYELAGGQPIASYTHPSIDPLHSANTLPSEVAICLSYSGTDDPASSTARSRGRIFCGPITGNALGERVNSEYQSEVLDFGEALASVGFAGNTTWMIHSRANQNTVKIESIWVDDAWDTQRRRGLAPTGRVVRDVQ